MKTLLLYLATALAASAAPSPAPFVKRLQDGGKLTIVTMGTSLTGGKVCWPDVMMAGWLNRDYTGQVTLFNEGVGASASSVGPGNNAALSGLGKLPSVLAHKPDVVFIEFSINDAYLPYNIALEESEKNLNTIIDGILKANPKTEIILQTMNPVIDRPAQGADGAATLRPKLADYVEVYRQVAKTRNLRLVDHFPNWQTLMREDPAEFDRLVPDGVHPQGSGYWQVLLPELKRALVSPSPGLPVVYLQNPTDRSMTVCVLAPSATTREVTVVLKAGGAPESAILPARATAIPGTTWTVWKALLDGLEPGTRYPYQLRYQSGDQELSTPVHDFRTLDPAAKSLRAIAFNDTHMGSAVMAKLMGAVKPEDFDFSLLLGDILEGSPRSVIETWNQYVGLLDGANKPIVYVRGNHDVRGRFAKRLHLLFDLPNLDPAQPWGEDQWQYTLHAGPVDFLVLDTGEDDDDRTAKDSYKNPDLWQLVRKRQVAWLEQTLAAKPGNPARWHVLLTHIPLYNSPWCSIRSRKLWTPLLSEWKPDLALSGHDHKWRPAQLVRGGDPWPTLVGGGPAAAGGEEGTMMILSADGQSLKVRLVGARDGRQLTEFVADLDGELSYRNHPQERGIEADTVKGADKLAWVTMTAGLKLRNEPVDVFVTTGAKTDKVSDKVIDRAVSNYAKRREWKEAIKLQRTNTLLESSDPARAVPDLKALRKLVEAHTDSSGLSHFDLQVLGEDAGDAGARAKVMMETFFAKSCRHTRVVELSDGGQQTGFFVGTLRKTAKGNELVGFVSVWD